MEERTVYQEVLSNVKLAIPNSGKPIPEVRLCMPEVEAPQGEGNGSPPIPPNNGVWQRSVRDIVIVGTGVFLLVNEALSNLERPMLIAAAIGCFGLPFAIRADERRK
jgi:hypothetical protein